MASEFNMKKVTTPLLPYMLEKELRFPRLFLLRCKLTLGRFKKTIDRRFPGELTDLAALPAWIHISLKQKIGREKAFEIKRVVLLTGGTAVQNVQFDTVHKERNFQNFSESEIENNCGGLVRWNKMEIVERSAQRFEIKVTRCIFHEFAASAGIPEMTPIVCQIDNAMFNSCLPDEMTFDRGGTGRRIADGKRECNFVWELRRQPEPPVQGCHVRRVREAFQLYLGNHELLTSQCCRAGSTKKISGKWHPLHVSDARRDRARRARQLSEVRHDFSAYTRGRPARCRIYLPHASGDSQPAAWQLPQMWNAPDAGRGRNQRC